MRSGKLRSDGGRGELYRHSLDKYGSQYAAWGGRDARLGNNPVVFAIPHGDTPVLVDVAMSMFSYGKLESYARSGKELPVDGGYNKNQQITKNAAEILETHQCIPIGYWKGSGLSLALDLIAATLQGDVHPAW